MSKTQPAPAKLSDTQLVILSAAAQHADGSLLPFPQSLNVKGAALRKVVETLRNRKLVQERRTVPGAPEWGRDESTVLLACSSPRAGFLLLELMRRRKPN